MDEKQPVPAHICLATFRDAAAIARVHVDSWRSTYSGILSEEFLRNLSYKQRRDRWLEKLASSDGAEFVYVSLNRAGRIVGFASGGPEREGDALYKGELYAIYLLAAAQRQGLGRQLLLAVARHLLQHGMPSMLIWVLAENPARRFYEAMGGKYVREQMLEIGGELLKEVAYGWDDINALLQKLEA